MSSTNNDDDGIIERQRQQQQQSNNNDDTTTTSCSFEQQERRTEESRRRPLQQQQQLLMEGVHDNHSSLPITTTSSSNGVGSSSSNADASSSAVSSKHPPQDGRNSHHAASTSYADAVMNGSLPASMTHLAMNATTTNLPIQQSRGLGAVPEYNDSHTGGGGGNNNDCSNSNTNNSNKLPIHHPDPNHSSFTSQSGGQTTCQHTAINYTDYRRRASDAMSIDYLDQQSCQSSSLAVDTSTTTTTTATVVQVQQQQQHLGGDGVAHGNAKGTNVGGNDTAAVILPQQQQLQAHLPLQIQREDPNQMINDGGIATYSSIIIQSSSSAAAPSGVVHGGVSSSIQSSQQQQQFPQQLQQQLQQQHPSQGLVGDNGGNVERSNDTMDDGQQHQYHHHQEEGQSQQQQQPPPQPQHAELTIQNNDTTTTTTFVGEATMAVHNHDYTTITTPNNNNNNNNNNSTTSSQSSTSSQMIISVPTPKQLWGGVGVGVGSSPLSHTSGGTTNLGGVGVGVRLMERLSDILRRGTLVMINFSQRNLGSNDAPLIRSAILTNPQLAVLKLGYNNLGNAGANLIAEAIHVGGGLMIRRSGSSSVDVGSGGSLPLQQQQQQQSQQQQQQQQQQQYRHHPSLSVLDLGFNNISDEGCTSLANLAVARNPSLATLYLSGNAVREAGALALADVIAAGCGLTSLHLTANRICARGVKGLMRSIAEFDVTMQMAQQDRENRMALEEEKRKRVMKSNNGDHVTRGGGEGVGEEQDAILDSLDLGDGDDGPDDFARLSGFKCIKELHLGGTNMESTGCLSVSNMLLTNFSLRVLCLSDNGLNDQDLSLFSQSISRNRQLPLETLRLSFNKLTCVGVETLMNAIWGSKTLREIKLDNNQIRDRGAQLAAVVLTSVELEVLDMGFNRLTIVGIKALMKSLAENCSLLTLTLSGNVLDTNASKAVSYALAYNKTIQKLYVDHCSLSYAAQRHIAAGIVSNSKLALRVMSGFPLGAISVTLGLPGAMENWTNEQVLKFIRVMWDRTRHEREDTTSGENTPTIGSTEASVNATSVNSAEKEEPKSGPSDPATVVAAAKGAFEALGDAGGALLLTEEPQRAISDTSPMVSSDAVMLEKTPSGTVRVPSLNEYPHEHFHTSNHETAPLDASVSHASHASVDSLCTANGKSCPETPVDPEAKKRNMEWLRLHYRSLNEIIQLPYVYADLLQLYRYFYSSGEVEDEDSVHDGMPPPGPGFNLGTAPSPTTSKMSGLQRKISYRGLDVIAGGKSMPVPSSNFSHASESSSKRRPMSEDESMQPPANKRARSGKPRIDYFPRLKAQVENCLSSSKQTKALILLRQLKFVETTMFQGSNPYCDQSLQAEPNEPTALDAEIILIDMI